MPKNKKIRLGDDCRRRLANGAKALGLYVVRSSRILLKMGYQGTFPIVEDVVDEPLGNNVVVAVLPHRRPDCQRTRHSKGASYNEQFVLVCL